MIEIKHHVQAAPVCGNLFSTWDIGSDDNRKADEKTKRWKKAREMEEKAKVQRRVFGNIILMGIRYHLQMILQYLITYRSDTSHCFSTGDRFRAESSRMISFRLRYRLQHPMA